MRTVARATYSALLCRLQARLLPARVQQRLIDEAQLLRALDHGLPLCPQVAYHCIAWSDHAHRPSPCLPHRQPLPHESVSHTASTRQGRAQLDIQAHNMRACPHCHWQRTFFYSRQPLHLLRREARLCREPAEAAQDDVNGDVRPCAPDARAAVHARHARLRLQVLHATPTLARVCATALAPAQPSAPPARSSKTRDPGGHARR